MPLGTLQFWLSRSTWRAPARTPIAATAAAASPGVAVFLLLAVVAGVVVTGLFSGSDENSGPFVGRWGLELSEAHEVLFRVLQGLVIIHVLGVVVEFGKPRTRLCPP